MESGAVSHSVFTTVSFRLIAQTLPSALNTHTSRRSAPQEPWTLKFFFFFFFMGLIMRGHQVKGWHIKEFIFFMCTKKNLEHNLNRTMIEATRLFDRNPFYASPVSSVQQQRTRPLGGALPPITLPGWLACTLHRRLIFRRVKLHIDRNRQIPSAICKEELFLESRAASLSPFLWCRDS